jgi:hypothetical protein
VTGILLTEGTRVNIVVEKGYRKAVLARIQDKESSETGKTFIAGNLAHHILIQDRGLVTMIASIIG